MYLGHILEQGPAEEIYKNPSHPYTQSLISAIPEINPDHRKNVFYLKVICLRRVIPLKGVHFIQGALWQSQDVLK